jgi:hypothetical protein
MITSLKMGLPKKCSCLYDRIQRLEDHVLVSEQEIPIVSTKRAFKKGMKVCFFTSIVVENTSIAIH